MAGFDNGPVTVSAGLEGEDDLEAGRVDHQEYKKNLKDFLMHFGEGQFGFKYRDQLRRNYNVGQFWVEVKLEDIIQYDEDLSDRFKAYPSEFNAVFEEAAKEVVDELTRPRPDDQPEIEDIQVMLISDGEPSQIRELRSDKVSKLERIHGIVLTASGVRAKATKMSLMCRSCRSVLPNITVKPGLEGYALPRRCATNQGAQAGSVKCPMDPYFILPDRCSCVDFQVLKLQESPDCVPSGEMPRHMTMYCERYLCERAVPGNRITVTGIYSIKKAAQTSKKDSEKNNTGVRQPYFRVFGIQLEMDGSGRSGKVDYNQKEEEEFRALASAPDCIERIVKSIAPSIYGAEDIKRAIACLLFGGSRKRLPDGLARRGDINVLLLGDPGTAKSQLLKFVEKASPIGVYTSGKGSSAAGLTASVNRDPATRNFVMEGGAMVLADGGVVCIDEFDKMREDDRVAIHEAMEQQTISIAKAGITTTLNSRCAVLAAANSIFGRWDDTKGDENIDFMPTILSRFDMIFIVKDEHSEERDTIMAKHVMQVHMSAQRQNDQLEQEGELSMLFLKKYIAYCKVTCGPRLTKEAAEKLKNKYVLMRSGNRDAEQEADRRNPIPITVRQLEAVIRMAESLAKMQLKPFATDVHIDEALRLFQVSTLDAASTGNLSGVEGFTTQEDHELLIRIETNLKRRMAIGTQVSEHTILQDFIRQKYDEKAIHKVIFTMIRRGELQHRLQRKMLYRAK